MAERVYTTPGIVLRKYEVGEASVSVLVLTKEHGLVRLRAQSARRGTGKLRYGLEPMTLGTYSFVRGMQSQRLVGVEVNEMLLSPKHGAARQAAGQISRLLIRLMPGEAFDDSIFALVEGGLRYLCALEATEVSEAECAIVLALLSRLGYLSENPTFLSFADEPLSPENLSRMKSLRSEAVRTINHALGLSGL